MLVSVRQVYDGIYLSRAAHTCSFVVFFHVSFAHINFSWHFIQIRIFLSMHQKQVIQMQTTQSFAKFTVCCLLYVILLFIADKQLSSGATLAVFYSKGSNFRLLLLVATVHSVLLKTQVFFSIPTQKNKKCWYIIV